MGALAIRQRAAEVSLGQTLDQSTPLGPLLGDVGWRDDLNGKAGRALHPGLLTQGLRNADNVHATVVTVLLRGTRLLHKHRFSSPAQERFQLASDAARVQGIAAVLRVIVGELAGVVMVDQEAPVGASGSLVGVVVNGEEDPVTRGKNQRLQKDS